MVLYRLAIANFRVRRARTFLTVAAIALSVSLVVAVTSGYKSMEGAAARFLNQYMGASDAFVVPVNEFQGGVPEKLVQTLSRDKDVRDVIGRLYTWRQMKRGANVPASRPAPSEDRLAAGAMPADELAVELIGVRRPEDTKTASQDLRAGKWFDLSSGNVAVVDQVAIEKLGIQLGDDVEIPGLHPLTLKIQGVVHKPTFFAQHAASLYVPMETLQRFTGQDNPALVTRISIDLRAGADYNAFKQRWTDRLATIDKNLRLHMRRENAGELEHKLRSVQLLSYLGGAVSMLTAMFIIFSALSMGVTERQRTLAMLRAVGATRAQIFTLVVLEGVVLSLVGIVVGILLGVLWMTLLYLRFEEMFAAGLSISLGGILFASAGSILTALVASLLPGWWASRVSPLEAMNAYGAGASAPGPRLGWALLGLGLVSIDPLLFFGPLEGMLRAMGIDATEANLQAVRLFVHFAAGLPGVMLGYFLLAPLLVWLIEKLSAPLLSRLLLLPASLLRQQLGSAVWRAAGTAAALMVALSTLIAMQVHGHTLIGGWKLPDKFPDVFIWGSDLIPWQNQRQLADVPGIQKGSLMPIVVTTPAGDSKTALALAAALAGQDVGTMFFAIDPDQAQKMVELEFRDNSGKPLPISEQADAQRKAVEELKKGRRMIVTDEFRQARHVKIGDTVALQTSIMGPRKYTVCGIVWSPGADVVISMFDLGRLLDQQTIGSVFGSIADAKRDFGVTGARLFAANLDGNIEKETLLKNVQAALRDRGLAAGDVRKIKSSMEDTFYRLLNLISTVAIAALAVASLGVTNTLMASVRSRRWLFGVLRSVGVCRGELLRLVLAEAIVLGLVGVALGFFAGMEMAVDARQLTIGILGYSPPISVPWMVIGAGCLAVMLVAILASLWPATSVARAQPLDLLQAGRAAT
ncbi:MAG: ABC transporter permease [Planctomycetota bacterium]|nr:ABC transporter permease [Planctomycetota bacterium]